MLKIKQKNTRSKSQPQMCWAPKLYLFLLWPLIFQELIRWRRTLTSHSMHTNSLEWCWFFLTVKYKLYKSPAIIDIRIVPFILRCFTLPCILLLLQILDWRGDSRIVWKFGGITLDELVCNQLFLQPLANAVIDRKCFLHSR